MARGGAGRFYPIWGSFQKSESRPFPGVLLHKIPVQNLRGTPSRTHRMDLAKSHLKIPRGDFHISIQKPLKNQFILPSASGSKLCENFHKFDAR